MEEIQPFLLHIMTILCLAGAICGSGWYLMLEAHTPAMDGQKSSTSIVGCAVLMGIIGASSGLCSAFVFAFMRSLL